MIHSIACIFRHFARTPNRRRSVGVRGLSGEDSSSKDNIGSLQKYIHGRMDGMPYFFDTHDPKQPTSSSSHSLTMPEYLRDGIGKYGDEISGTLSKNDSIETLRKYIESLDLPTNKTYHTFEDCLSTPEYNALQDIKYSEICRHISLAHPKHILTPIVSMNELYVSCIGADGSDRVFETPHVDGLFAWLPWCIVYRVVVSIQGNRNVDTVFPLSQHKYTLETRDYVAFDYNRSIHYIVGTTPPEGILVDDRKRIILKLHYLVYPEWLPVWVSRVYVEIHGKYNAFLRGLFLKSQFSVDDNRLTLEKKEEKIEETISQRWIVRTPELRSFVGVRGITGVGLPSKVIAAFINTGTTVYVKLFLIGLYVYNNLRG
jgi:hypothetical protein